MPNPGKAAREAIVASRVRRGMRSPDQGLGLSMGWDKKYGSDYGAENQYVISSYGRAERFNGQAIKGHKSKTSSSTQGTAGISTRVRRSQTNKLSSRGSATKEVPSYIRTSSIGAPTASISSNHKHLQAFGVRSYSAPADAERSSYSQHPQVGVSPDDEAIDENEMYMATAGRTHMKSQYSAVGANGQETQLTPGKLARGGGLAVVRAASKLALASGDRSSYGSTLQRSFSLNSMSRSHNSDRPSTAGSTTRRAATLTYPGTNSVTRSTYLPSRNRDVKGSGQERRPLSGNVLYRTASDSRTSSTAHERKLTQDQEQYLAQENPHNIDYTGTREQQRANRSRPWSADLNSRANGGEFLVSGVNSGNKTVTKKSMAAVTASTYQDQSVLKSFSRTDTATRRGERASAVSERASVVSSKSSVRDVSESEGRGGGWLSGKGAEGQQQRDPHPSRASMNGAIARMRQDNSNLVQERRGWEVADAEDEEVEEESESESETLVGDFRRIASNSGRGFSDNLIQDSRIQRGIHAHRGAGKDGFSVEKEGIDSSKQEANTRIHGFTDNRVQDSRTQGRIHGHGGGSTAGKDPSGFDPKQEAPRKKPPALTIDVSEEISVEPSRGRSVSVKSQIIGSKSQGADSKPGSQVASRNSSKTQHIVSPESNRENSPDRESEPVQLINQSHSPMKGSRSSSSFNRSDKAVVNIKEQELFNAKGAKGSKDAMDPALRWSWDREKADPSKPLFQSVSRLWSTLGLDYDCLLDDIMTLCHEEDDVPSAKKSPLPPSKKSQSLFKVSAYTYV